MTLTKTEYLLFLKHPAWLWLKKYQKDKLPPIDPNTQAMFDAGNKLEDYAEKLFPEGVHLGFNSYGEYQTLANRTQDATASGYKTLFQARFDVNNLICLTDVVEFSSPQSLKLYEIKSSTKVKPEHHYDLAFQTQVLEESGYQVESIFVIHVNSSYIRSGDIKPNKLLKIIDVTKEVRALADYTVTHIKQAFNVANSLERPSISPRYCRLNSMSDWLTIYRSLVEIPEQSIYDLNSPSAQLIAELEDRDISLIENISEEFKLTKTQEKQAEAVKEGGPSFDRIRIKNFLKKLVYPLYFLDYETCADVIPPYNGTRPYQQVPTQYSLHILEAPGASLLEHRQHLERSQNCPSESLATQLKKDIGSSGSVLVWYANFEAGRNEDMGELLPQYRQFFKDLNKRIVDLMLPFSQGFYTDSAFLGSASIKNVLPVLIPELSYKKLAIQDGQTAQRLWMEAVLEDKGTAAQKSQLFQDLLTYCQLDTLAMVKIYQKLSALVDDKQLSILDYTS